MAIIGISGKIGSGKDTAGNIIQYLICLDKNKLADHQVEQYIKDFQEFKMVPVSNQRQSGWEIKKFALKLKQITALLTGCTLEQLEDQEFKKRELLREWWYILGYKDNEIYPMYATEHVVNELGGDRIHKYTYREMLQKVGTEAMRNSIHENVWVNALFADYKKNMMSHCHDDGLPEGPRTPMYPNWIITDMRFPNELEAVKKNAGITIRIERSTGPIPATDNLSSSEMKIMDISKPEHPSETALDDAAFDYTIYNAGTIDELIEKVKEILVKEKIIS